MNEDLLMVFWCDGHEYAESVDVDTKEDHGSSLQTVLIWGWVKTKCGEEFTKSIEGCNGLV